MELVQLNKNIVNKVPAPLYIFVGDDIAFIKLYINQIASQFNLEPRILKSFEESINYTTHLFSLENEPLNVIYYDLAFLKNDKQWEALKELGDTYIFVYEEIPKSFSDYFKENITIFTKPKEEHLLTQIDIPLDSKYSKLLITLNDYNYTALLNDIDKIKNYSNITNKDVNRSFLELLDNNLLGIKNDNNIFVTIDDFIRGDYRYIYEEIKTYNPLQFLSLMQTSLKNLYLVKEGKGDIDRLSKASGLTTKMINLYLNKKTIYSNEKLLNLLLLVGEIERGIKKGIIPQELSIDYFLALGG